MCISVFYAQVLGLWLFLLGSAMFMHQARLKKTLLDSLGHPSLMTFMGFFGLGLGLVIVVTHNIWVSSWPVLITLFGWFLIIQGITRVFWPETFGRIIRDITEKSGYTLLTWLWLIVGVYLIWIGFFN